MFHPYLCILLFRTYTQLSISQGRTPTMYDTCLTTQLGLVQTSAPLDSCQHRAGPYSFFRNHCTLNVRYFCNVLLINSPRRFCKGQSEASREKNPCKMSTSVSNVKKLLNLIISLSLLYLVLCTIPHFNVLFYMLLVIYLINQFP